MPKQVFKLVSPAVNNPISTSNRFTVLNGHTQGHNGPPFDSNHDPGPSAVVAAIASNEPSRMLPAASISLESFHTQLNHITTSSRSLIKLSGLVSGQPAVFLIDSGCTGNFVNDAFVNKHHVSHMSLPSQDIVTLADGSQQTAAVFVPSASIVIGSYSDRLDLVALPLSGYDVILGMPWLHHYNPRINWQQKSIKFTGSDHFHHLRMSADSRRIDRQRRSKMAAAIVQAPIVHECQNRCNYQTNVDSSSISCIQCGLDVSSRSDRVPVSTSTNRVSSVDRANSRCSCARTSSEFFYSSGSLRSPVSVSTSSVVVINSTSAPQAASTCGSESASELSACGDSIELNNQVSREPITVAPSYSPCGQCINSSSHSGFLLGVRHGAPEPRAVLPEAEFHKGKKVATSVKFQQDSHGKHSPSCIHCCFMHLSHEPVRIGPPHRHNVTCTFRDSAAGSRSQPLSRGQVEHTEYDPNQTKCSQTPHRTHVDGVAVTSSLPSCFSHPPLADKTRPVESRDRSQTPAGAHMTDHEACNPGRIELTPTRYNSCELNASDTSPCPCVLIPSRSDVG